MENELFWKNTFAWAAHVTSLFKPPTKPDVDLASRANSIRELFHLFCYAQERADHVRKFRTQGWKLDPSEDSLSIKLDGAGIRVSEDLVMVTCYDVTSETGSAGRPDVTLILKWTEDYCWQFISANCNSIALESQPQCVAPLVTLGLAPVIYQAGLPELKLAVAMWEQKLAEVGLAHAQQRVQGYQRQPGQ